MRYPEMAKQQLIEEYEKVKSEHSANVALGLKLDMSRGKPGADQLELSSELYNLAINSNNCKTDGTDIRNYGVVDGLPSCKNYFAELLNIKPEQIIVGGNASLQLMYDTIAKAYTHGLVNSTTPWGKLDVVKFLCPSPGYDRHFHISQSFNMELIPVSTDENGPDMDEVERLVQDESVKGMWCVPKYSNPSGIIYSDDVVERIAKLSPASADFIIMWDNAYCLHEFDGEFVEFKDIISLCAKYGRPDMVFEYTSTSKITWPGAGVGCMASSEANINYIKKLMGFQTIGYDKVNQVRHVAFLKNKENTLLHMKKHAAILKPKFDVVLDMLECEIAPLEIARWNKPKGGYFVSLDAMSGTAKAVFNYCKEAGVTLTTVGATFPYGNDPANSNIRIAPTFPPVDELKMAMRVLCTSLKLTALEKLLEA